MLEGFQGTSQFLTRETIDEIPLLLAETLPQICSCTMAWTRLTGQFGDERVSK